MEPLTEAQVRDYQREDLSLMFGGNPVCRHMGKVEYHYGFASQDGVRIEHPKRCRLDVKKRDCEGPCSHYRETLGSELRRLLSYIFPTTFKAGDTP